MKLTTINWRNFLKLYNLSGNRIEGAVCQDCKNIIKTVFERRLAGHRMIGAMPAVAVRHERRRQENRVKRPSQLCTSSQWAQPSPNSPISPNTFIQKQHTQNSPEVYLCGKISGLHAIVILLLLGAIILVVGLVQLAPGATSDHKVSLLYAGSVLLILGIGLTGLRCYLLQCFIVTSKSPSSSPVNADNTSQLPSTSNL